jgi:hypothetical protein
MKQQKYDLVNRTGTFYLQIVFALGWSLAPTETVAAPTTLQ